MRAHPLNHAAPAPSLSATLTILSLQLLGATITAGPLRSSSSSGLLTRRSGSGRSTPNDLYTRLYTSTDSNDISGLHPLTAC